MKRAWPSGRAGPNVLRPETSRNTALPRRTLRRPFFTSRGEWDEAAASGERDYVRNAMGYVVRGGIIGFTSMVVGAGAVDPYWRSVPVLVTYGVCLILGTAGSALLFRREWRAARRAYGTPLAR